MTKKPRTTTRRAFLQGTSGALFLLPLADFILHNGRLAAADNPAAPKRLFTMFFPNGANSAKWNFAASLSPLAPLQSKMLAIHSLSNPAATETNLPEGHGSGAATAFTGATVPASDPKHLSGGPTLDQFAVQQLKPTTLVPSLVSGLCSQSAHHTGMFGVHCFVRSWQDQNTYIAPTRNPVDVFNTLFGQAWEQVVNKDERETQRKRSVLDTVLAQYKTVTAERYGLGVAGRSRLSDHFDSLRELEKNTFEMNVQVADACRVKPAIPVVGDPGLPHSVWDEVLALHADLLVHAMRCDITRFGNISFGESAEYYRRAEIGVVSGHEAAHNSDTTLYEAYVTHYMRLFATLWTKLDAVKEADGRSLLDNSLFYVATELGDQAQAAHHSVHPTVVLLAGGASSLAMGRVIDGTGHTINDALAAAAGGFGLDANLFGEQRHRRTPIT